MCIRCTDGVTMKKIYYNGTIHTMSKPATVQAVLTENGKIIAVGTRKELQDKTTGAKMIDLNGKTMLPAFIDAHSHLSSYAVSFLQVPLEECIDFDEIAKRLQQFISSNQIKPGTWVIGKGYDHNVLAERRHPTLKLLDDCAPQNPVALQHTSGHVGVMNSLALKELGITPLTPSPEGGKIGIENGQLTGYLEESAYFTYLKKLPIPDEKELMNAYQRAQQSYASYGITTIQEGMMVQETIPLYETLIAKELLWLDTIGYVPIDDANKLFSAFPDSVKKYNKHFKLGGYKIFLDGSPQGRTAWMREPYIGGEQGYCGYGTMRDDEVCCALETAVRHDMQILAHCNGDAAAQQYLDAVAHVRKKHDLSQVRPVMIHAQLLGRDQLDRVKEYGITPSFFVAHVYHWGDIHLKNFGINRASAISPAATALQKKIKFTFHQDAPVIAPNMLETIWCAVNRVTKSGKVLGEDERISVMEALKAVTINAAWQYFEEDIKGSIQVGKNADFVILDKDPFTVPPMEIRNIRVMETIKGDCTIYRATGNNYPI